MTNKEKYALMESVLLKGVKTQKDYDTLEKYLNTFIKKRHKCYDYSLCEGLMPRYISLQRNFDASKNKDFLGYLTTYLHKAYIQDIKNSIREIKIKDAYLRETDTDKLITEMLDGNLDFHKLKNILPKWCVDYGMGVKSVHDIARDQGCSVREVKQALRGIKIYLKSLGYCV